MFVYLLRQLEEGDEDVLSAALPNSDGYSIAIFFVL